MPPLRLLPDPGGLPFNLVGGVLQSLVVSVGDLEFIQINKKRGISVWEISNLFVFLLLVSPPAGRC